MADPVADFHIVHVAPMPVDEILTDIGAVGPELAHLSRIYLRSPRALIWRRPSPEWRLLVLLPPLASRLSLLANPIFAQLTRTWGLATRFIGVDADGLVHDFRGLLTDRTLRLLVDLLDMEVSDDARLLDTLFAALATEMLTVVQSRAHGWGRHLDVASRLEPALAASLFARDGRFPDYLAQLRRALHDGLIDADLYGRALRAVDRRELSTETQLAAQIRTQLDDRTLQRLDQAGVGQHLGCYNWLHLGHRHLGARSHVLGRLPGLATFLAETLLPLDAALIGVAAADQIDNDRRPAPTTSEVDLRSHRDSGDALHDARWAATLRRAIDAGQDRTIIEALARWFRVDDNLIRRLWRDMPAGLGQPPTWQLRAILNALALAGDRGWPTTSAQWESLVSRAVPPVAR